MTGLRTKSVAVAAVGAALLVAGLAAAIAANPSPAHAAAPAAPAVCDHSTGPKTFTLDLTTGPAACGGAVGGCDSTVNPTLPACWTCTSATTAHPLDLDDVTIIVNADVVKEGVRFGPGCTGRIGKLTVVTQGGDGIKAVKGAHDLVIGGGSVTCKEPTGRLHDRPVRDPRVRRRPDHVRRHDRELPDDEQPHGVLRQPGADPRLRRPGRRRAEQGALRRRAASPRARGTPRSSARARTRASPRARCTPSTRPRPDRTAARRTASRAPPAAAAPPRATRSTSATTRPPG